MKAILFLYLVLVGSFASAAEIVREVTGYGASYQTAVDDGLTQAVEQQFGMTIDATEIHSLVVTQDQKGGEYKDSAATNSIRKTKGFINGYDILSRQCNGGDCEVELSVRLTQYKTPGLPSDKRRRIVVLPFSGDKKFREMMTREIQEQVVQSRRFSVLDRTHDRQYQAEKSLLLSDDAPVSEKARLGKVLGLDYILMGSIEKVKKIRWTDSVSLTGETKSHSRITATVRYQILAVATRQIKWSDTVTVNVENDVSWQKMAAISGEKVVNKLLSNIYPLRVVQLNNNQVILNQGGKTIRDDAYYTVYALGKLIIDPYSKEPLGHSETRIATIKVDRVEAKVTYATVVKGDIGLIKPGFIVRPDEKTARTVKEKSSESVSEDIKIPKAGGIIL